MHIYIVFNNLKFTLKHLKRSYVFRSYDHPQGDILCYFGSKSLSVLNCNFSKDDSMIEICSSVLSDLV